MGVEWIEHKGRQILYMDFRDQETPQMIEHLELGQRMILELPEESKFLGLYNYTGATVTVEYMARVKELGKAVFEPRSEKTAILGVTGIRHILLAAYNRVTGAGATQKLFDNRQEALEWLVS